MLLTKPLSPAERLIVAADFKPASSSGARTGVAEKVIALAESLRGTGVTLKVNSALRAVGYDLIDAIHGCGLKVFADLKLYDIPETLATDGALLGEAKPEFLTVVCSCGMAAMKSLKAALPGTEVLGVTLLTSLNVYDSHAIFSCSVEEAVLRFSRLAAAAGVDGVISSPKEVELLRANLEMPMTINTPGIRPGWAAVPGDDQNPERSTTPAEAIRAGADRIVVGRPIVNAKNPYDAVMKTIEEIAAAAE